jgi:hypothetical protein
VVAIKSTEVKTGIVDIKNILSHKARETPKENTCQMARKADGCFMKT